MTGLTDLASIIERRDQLEAELCRRSLRAFVQRAWSIIEPGRELIWNWHHDLMCDDLERAERGETPGKREVFNVPPGTTKTLMLLVFFPAWCWTRNTSKRFIAASYGADITTETARQLRELVESEWYQELYNVELADDQNQKTRFNTSTGGYYLATSVGGKGTGKHPDFILIDDPITEKQSRSEKERNEANTWFDRTLGARGVGRGVCILLVMQRLHEDDLSGHVLKRAGSKTQNGYRGTHKCAHLCLPMRYVRTRPKTDQDVGYAADPRDPRTEPGSLLWPEVFTEAKVVQLEIDLGPYGTAGQLQQLPVPEGGGLFKREWFEGKFVAAAPKVARRVRGWDTASTEGDGDYTCGVKIAEKKGLFFIEDVIRDQLSPAGVDAIIKQTARADDANGKGTCAQREEREGGGASAKAITGIRAKALVGHDYAEVLVSASKVLRSKAFRAQVQAGNVYLVKGPWNEEYIRELTTFTGKGDKHDDQVDASSCAFNCVLLEPEPVEEFVTW